MLKLSGKSVYKGIALGTVVVLNQQKQMVKRIKIENPEDEIRKVDESAEQAKKQLSELYEKALKEVGESSAEIFEVHQMMLEDEDYLDAIYNMIRTEMVNAEYAVAVSGDNFADMFANMDDEYMQARAADIRDISNRLIKNLKGYEETNLDTSQPVIIVADDLSPSETIQLDKEKILAFVTVHGSSNSHTAILARMMNIPALIGVPVNLEEIYTGMTAVVDGFHGEVIFEPNQQICDEAQKKIEEEKEKIQLLQTLKNKENVTLDGKKSISLPILEV